MRSDSLSHMFFDEAREEISPVIRTIVQSFFFFFSSRRRHTRSDRDWSSDVFFFFQAEDGIRDLIVTGVQTCALPIFGVATIADGSGDGGDADGNDGGGANAREDYAESQREADAEENLRARHAQDRKSVV